MLDSSRLATISTTSTATTSATVAGWLDGARMLLPAGKELVSRQAATLAQPAPTRQHTSNQKPMATLDRNEGEVS